MSIVPIFVEYWCLMNVSLCVHQHYITNMIKMNLYMHVHTYMHLCQRPEHEQWHANHLVNPNFHDNMEVIFYIDVVKIVRDTQPFNTTYSYPMENECNFFITWTFALKHIIGIFEFKHLINSSLHLYSGFQF